MIAVEENDRFVVEVLVFKFLNNIARLFVHVHNIGEKTSDHMSTDTVIGIIRRHFHIFRINQQRFFISCPHLRFMRYFQVENGKERLILMGSVSPMGFLAAFIPNGNRRFKLIILFGIVRTVITCLS